MQVFRQVITSLPGWWQAAPVAVPVPAPVQPDDGLNAAFCSAQGDWLLVYLSQPCRFTLRQPVCVGSSSPKVSWIDPQTGQHIPFENPSAEFYPLSQEFSTPVGWRDSLLLVEA
jgi:hypothetical protein